MTHDPTQPTMPVTAPPRRSRSLPRVGASLHREDAPRVIELGTGRVLSGAEMASEKALGDAAVIEMAYRRERETRAYLRELAWTFLQDGSDVLHRDTLHIRLHTYIQTLPAPDGCEPGYWSRQWECVRDTAHEVFAAHVAGLRKEAEKDAFYPRHCGPDDGDVSADEQLERIAADGAHRVAIQRGGA
jgi:hypothetical protein